MQLFLMSKKYKSHLIHSISDEHRWRSIKMKLVYFNPPMAAYYVIYLIILADEAPSHHLPSSVLTLNPSYFPLTFPLITELYHPPSPHPLPHPPLTAFAPD